MSLPLVAVVGRPNVGKSTLINRIIGSQHAIVHESSGVTRDRSYHEAEWNGKLFRLIDTGGVEIGSDDEFQLSIRSQVDIATREAAIILMLVDGQVGVTADDERLARMLRKAGKDVVVVVNKLDTPGNTDGLYEFYALGLGDVFPISAIHGLGTGDLLDEVVGRLQEAGLFDEAQETSDTSIKVAIIGRPNAGKSSLTNQLTSFDRAIVSDVAGTTRDAIDTVVKRDQGLYTIIDTAGLRRKSQIDEDVEYYGFVRAMRAIEKADVAILVIDGSLGLTDQDQRVARFAHDRGCALVIALNKWDIVDGPDRKSEVRTQIEERMMHVAYAPLIAISALTGKHVDRIWDGIDLSYEHYSQSIPTNKLNVWLSDIREVGHGISRGKVHFRIKYVTQTGTCPPVFTFFANRPDIVDDNYERYLENDLRKHFDLSGTPIRLKFKKKD